VASLADLCDTRTEPWDEFWIQGGHIRAEQRSQPGIYEVSQLVAGSASHLWILADGVDTGDKDEVFFMSPSRDREFGQEKREKLFRPRRLPIESFPPDLDLTRFEQPPRAYSLVTIHRDATVDRAYETVSVDAGLLVTGARGERLLFYCDQNVPLDVYVTMNDMHIREYIAAAASVRAACEPPEA
jgi:hypothetical protein